MEVWLRTNTRAVLLGMIVPAAVLVAALTVAVTPLGSAAPLWLRMGCAALAIVAAAVLVVLAAQLRKPRMAYADKHLLVWLRGAAPYRVPIEYVECFWLGQTASLLPGKRHQQTETAAVIVRIADRAAEWRHQEVKPQLGSWCEGYITIRGTWCEPIHIDVVNRLNQRLADVTAAQAKMPT